MKCVFLLILCTVGAFGLSINFDSNVKGLEVKVNKPYNGTSSETRDANNEVDDKEPGGPTLQKFFEYLGPVKTIPQIVDETVERFQTIYRSPKDQLKTLEEVENPNESNVVASENEIQRRKRSTDTISGNRLTPYWKITKRSGEDAPCVSNSDLQEHKLSENEEINAIKEEMQKLKDLIVILRDQQHVVDMLNSNQNQKNDFTPKPQTDQNNNDENVKLVKLMESLITQMNSQSFNSQKPTTRNSVSLPTQRSDNFMQLLTTMGTTTTVRPITAPPTTVEVKTEESSKTSAEDVKDLIGNLRSIEERLSRLVQLKQRMAETKEEEREAEGRSLTVHNNDNNTETTTTSPVNNNQPINNTFINNSIEIDNHTVEDHKNNSEEIPMNKDTAILSRIDEIKTILDKLTDIQSNQRQNSQSEFVGNMEQLLATKPNEENSTSENSLKLEQLAKTLQLLRYLQDISSLQTELEKNTDKEPQLQSGQVSEGPSNFEIQLNNLSKVVKNSDNEAKNPIESNDDITEIQKSNDDRTRNASNEIEESLPMVESNDEKMRDVSDENEEFETEVINQALENLEEGEQAEEEEEAREELKPSPSRSYGSKYDKEDEGGISSSEHIPSDYGGNYNGRPPIPKKPTPYYTKYFDPEYLKHVCKSLHPYYPPPPPHPPPPPPQYINQNNYRPYHPRPIEIPYMEKPPNYYKENRPAPPMHSYEDRYPGPYKTLDAPPPQRPMYPSQYPHRQEYESPHELPYRPPFLDSSSENRPIPYGRSSEGFQLRSLEGNPQEQQRNPFENPAIQNTSPRNVEDLKMKLRSLEARVAELGHVEDSNEDKQRHVENLQRLISNLKLEIQEATNRENRNSVQQSLNFIRRNKREIREDDVNVERQAGELVDKLYNMLEGSRLADDDDIDNDAILQQLPRASMERSIEMEQRQLQSQIEQLKKKIDSSPTDEGNISKIPLQSSDDDSNTTPSITGKARSSSDDEESDKARTLSHHPLTSGPSRYYHEGHNYGPGYGVSKHYSHKKDILSTIIEKIFDKLQHAIPSIVKGLVGDFIDGAFYDHGYAGHGYGSGYGYGADKYDYGHDISYKFKSFGLLGTLPLALLNILSTISYFFKLLQRNKFIRNFLIPVGVIIAVTGLVAFLVFWFNYDAFAGSMYGGYNGYQKIGGYDGYQKGGYDSYQKVGYENHHKGGGYDSYQKPGYKGVSYSPSYSYKKPYYRDSNAESFTPPFTHNLDNNAINHEPSFPGIVTQITDQTKPKM